MIFRFSESLDLFYQLEGEGTPLLLLHGFTGSHETWTPFIEEWKSTYQLIIVDIVGHGQSQVRNDLERESSLFTMETMAKSLEALLHHLGFERAAILGYSMGGRLALYFSVHYPERVLGMLLESASPGLRTASEREVRRQRDEALATRILERGVRPFVQEWEDITLFESQKKLPESIQSRIRSERLNQTKEGLAGSLIGMGTGAQASLWEYLKTIKIPVFLVVGEWDPKFIGIANQMSESLPFSRQFVILHAGHAVHVEQFEIFVKIVRDEFLPALKSFKKGTSLTYERKS